MELPIRCSGLLISRHMHIATGTDSLTLILSKVVCRTEPYLAISALASGPGVSRIGR